MYNTLKEYLDGFVEQFISRTHIYLYSLRKNLAIINFIITCKINKDYTYYKNHPLGYFTKKLELWTDKDI